MEVLTFNSTKDLLDHLAGRTSPCRTTISPTTTADSDSSRGQTPVTTNYGPAKIAEKTTSLFPPTACGASGNAAQAIAPPKLPEPKKPATIFTVIKLEMPEKPKVAVRNIGIGQALVHASGNVIYRLALDLYLSITPYVVTVHYSADTLPTWEGTLAPLGSKLTIKL